MKLIDLVIILIIVLIVGMAIYTIIKNKKSGSKCMGCPNSSCSGKCK